MDSTITDLSNWIGCGVQFPKPFSKRTGGLITNVGEDRINQSIYYILSTRKGERFFLPKFGSNLDKCLFEQNDQILSTKIQLAVRDALTEWEPRISLISVSPQIGTYDNEVPIIITYKIKGTNMTGNYIYPFKTEAMQLGDA